MAARVLTLREVNRATLARQLLLERSPLTVPAAVEQLVGLQAQQPISPYIGLWTRLNDFQRDDLAQLIQNRAVVKATLMRSTLHLVTADDYLLLRATLQPMMTSGWEAIARGREVNFDVKMLVAAAKDYLSEQPRTFAEISAMLTERMPDSDVGAMRYGVRTHLPLVQVPIDTTWSYPGNPQFALAETWLNQPIPDEEHLRMLVFRYLAAFGPASVADLQTWSGLGKLKASVETLKPDLVVYRDEKKRDLLDLPDLPLPNGDTPAPVRFLPEYDNLLLSHKDRSRIIDDAYRSKVYLPGLRVRSTFLVDGFVQGAWKIEKTKSAASLVIEPFEALTKPTHDALHEEAEKLLRFAAGDAKSFEVRFAD